MDLVLHQVGAGPRELEADLELAVFLDGWAFASKVARSS
jgi:hypothetical protein